MKITVFGATGKTGLSFCEQAAEHGHEVTAFVRTPTKLGETASKVSVVEGSLDDEAAISKAIEGSDAVVSALGTFDRKPNTVLSDATRRIIDAMKATGCPRLVAVTSMGCGDSRSQVNSFIMRMLIKTLAKEIWADKDRQEEVIKATDLDYLIVRPGGLTDKPATGQWTELRSGETFKGKQMISREDVAAYMLQRISQGDLGREAVTLF